MKLNLCTRSEQEAEGAEAGWQITQGCAGVSLGESCISASGTRLKAAGPIPPPHCQHWANRQQHSDLKWTVCMAVTPWPLNRTQLHDTFTDTPL
ncbi:hypothetical protein JZ751_021410 [Albula glossodonta]|uniref:Uncharacterized protein n=1 Tax=Albula glossodonta TaxID=121402 RepID=A0A8T2NSR1_9TELE|nr:hypothetical protein JZ751_021410 [Albula glossodonta]